MVKLTLINALVASSRCHMTTMVSYSNRTITLINYILRGNFQLNSHFETLFCNLSDNTFQGLESLNIHSSTRFLLKKVHIGVERSLLQRQLAARAIRAPPKALKHHAWLHLSFQPFRTVLVLFRPKFVQKGHNRDQDPGMEFWQRWA